MSKYNLNIYQTAYRMYQPGASIDQICLVVAKHRATVYRWLADIRRSGIQKFMLHKKTAKHRRPARRTPEHVITKIVNIRQRYGWCGAKIGKELLVNHSISLSVSTIYRYLHQRFAKTHVAIKGYHKHQAIVIADGSRQVIEHDTVDLGGGIYAYTALDIFTKEPSIVIGIDLTMKTGALAFEQHHLFYGASKLHQSDNGSEFQSDFVAAVLATGAKHRYSRPYKKNEQAHIENFNRCLRRECFPGSYQRSDLSWMKHKAKQYARHYINRRWHMGLPQMMTPAQFRQQSWPILNHAKIIDEKVEVSHLL